MNKGAHLTLSDRIHISSSLTQNKSFRQIASEINKDSTTISKEVKLHRQRIRSGSIGRIHNSCLYRFTCDH